MHEEKDRRWLARKGKKKEEAGTEKAKDWWVQRNPGKTFFIILLLPWWLPLLIEGGPLWVNQLWRTINPSSQTRPAVAQKNKNGKWGNNVLPHSPYTHQAQEEEQEQTDLIAWGPGTNAELRPRIVTEHMHKGECFAYMIPPQSEVELSIECFNPTVGIPPWNTFLVERNIYGRISPQNLKGASTSKHYTQGGVFEFPDLSSNRKTMREARKMINTTTTTNPVLVENYLQTDDFNNHQYTVEVTKTDGIRLYNVEAGRNGASFTVKKSGWEWIWIAALQTPNHQSALSEIPIPATGIPEKPESFKNENGHYNDSFPLQAIIVTVNGKERVLEKALLLSPKQLNDGTLKIRLNVPSNKDAWRKIRPATIIVGIQQK